MERIQSTCNYCALDCNIDFYVDRGRIVKVLPTAGYPVNNGFCCIKGLSLDKQQTVVKPGALPKARQPGGSFKTLSWDEAFAYCAEKIKAIQSAYGDEAFAGISTGQLTVEEFALLGHLMRNYLHTNLDGNTRLCMATSVVAHKQSFGFDAPGFTLKDLELSDTIFFIGANPVVSHPIIWDRVRKNVSKKVIVLDPRRSETARVADYWYGLRGKSDLSLLYTVANLLIEKNYIDSDFIAAHTEGFEEFKAFVSRFDMKRGVEASGLTPEAISEIVEHIHRGKKVSFWWTMGVNQGYEAVRTAQAIINLALLTGNIGKPGTGANSITGQCNAMGSRAFSNTAGLFGGGDFNNPARRAAVAAALGIEESLLPPKPTITYNAIIEGINAGAIKGLYLVCTNPRHSWTNNETFSKAAQKLEFLMVQDIYDTIESAEKASVFLPVVPGIKKSGTLINMERRLSAMRPALSKDENEKTDYEVFYGLGKALCMGHLLHGWETPKACFEFMKKCSRGMPCDITGVDWEELAGSHGVQWPFRAGEVLQEDERRLYGDGNFYTPSKKAQFKFEEPLNNPLPLSEKYPFMLNTGRGAVGQWHTQTRTREVRFVEDVSAKKAYLYLNTDDACALGIKENDQVSVTSVNGETALFAAKVTDNVGRKELFAPIHYIECNKLTPSVYDPYSKEPSYKATPVCIKKHKTTEVNRAAN